MAQQTIKFGTQPLGIGGDSFITAFDKCNANFTELYSSMREVSEGGNVYRYKNLVSYYNGASAAKGAIVIHLPKGKFNSSTMLTMRIRGYAYEANKGAWSLELGGYNYTGSVWHNHSSVLTGQAPFTQVQLAHAADHQVVILGVTTTTWAFSTIQVEELITQYSSTAGWGDGWSVTLETNLTQYTNVVTPTLLGTSRSLSADRLTTARTINNVAFDGTANITVADNTKLPLTGGTLSGSLSLGSSLHVAGSTNLNGSLSLGASNASIELGKIGTSNAPYIDFHSGAVSTDYDSRIIGSGGVGSMGKGNLTYIATTHNFQGNVFVTGGLEASSTLAVSGSDAVGFFKKLIECRTSTDGGYLAVGNTAQDKGFVEIGTVDDSDTEIVARKRNGQNQVLQEAKLLDQSGNTTFPGKVAAGGGFTGDLSGNASTASSATTANTANTLANIGNLKALIDGERAPSGLRVANAYQNGYPTAYGTLLQLGGGGCGEILVGWSGTSGEHAPTFIRSQRDYEAKWSDWAQVYTTAHPPAAPAVFSTGVAGLVPARVGSASSKYLREDGAWVTPANTTYSGMSSSELTAGTSTTARLISPADLKTAIQTHAPDKTAGLSTAKAWVTFNGRNTVSIFASSNVSSITDNGTGDYTVNFTNALPHNRYAVAIAAKEFNTTGSSGAVGALGVGLIDDVVKTTSCRIAAKSNTSYYDAAFMSFMAIL